MVQPLLPYLSGIVIPQAPQSLACGGSLTARLPTGSYRPASHCWRFAVVRVAFQCISCGERSAVLCSVCANVLSRTVANEEGPGFAMHCLDLESQHTITRLVSSEQIRE